MQIQDCLADIGTKLYWAAMTRFLLHINSQNIHQTQTNATQRQQSGVDSRRNRKLGWRWWSEIVSWCGDCPFVTCSLTYSQFVTCSFDAQVAGATFATAAFTLSNLTPPMSPRSFSHMLHRYESLHFRMLCAAVHGLLRSCFERLYPYSSVC